MELTVLLPEIVMLTMACLLLLLNAFRSMHYRLIYCMVQLAIVLAICFLMLQLSTPNITIFHGGFISDLLSRSLKIVLLGAAFFVMVYSRDYVAPREFVQAEYYVLSLISIFGMMVLISAKDLLVLYLGLESMSLPLYALIAFSRKSAIAIEAANKYFVLGAIASGLLLYGLSLLYGTANSLLMTDIMQHMVNSPAEHYQWMLLGLVFVFAAISFKLGLVPFNSWVPDVYEGAPISVLLLIATISKIATFGLLLRLLLFALPGISLEWTSLWVTVALCSVGVGNIIAIQQSNIKRMLGYSAIAHIGYMSFALGLGVMGFAVALFYMFSYLLTALMVFGALALLSRYGTEIERIDQLRGLAQREPWVAFLLLIAFFSMAGIPPTIGFFGKLWVLQSLVNAGLSWVSILVLLAAVIGAFYYLRVIRTMYFESPEEIIMQPQPLCLDARIALSINGLMILALGLSPSILMQWCRTIVGL